MGIKEWLFSVALKKAVKKIVQLVVAWLISAGTIAKAQTFGVTVDTATLQATLIPTIFGALEIARNYLKTKFNLTWL